MQLGIEEEHFVKTEPSFIWLCQIASKEDSDGAHARIVVETIRRMSDDLDTSIGLKKSNGKTVTLPAYVPMNLQVSPADNKEAGYTMTAAVKAATLRLFMK